MSGKIYCWGILLSSIVFLGSLNANSDIVDHQNFVDQLNRVLKEELGNREVDSPYAKTIELSLGQKSNFNKQSLEILIDSVLKESDLPVEAGSRMKWVIQLFKSANHQIALGF